MDGLKCNYICTHLRYLLSLYDTDFSTYKITTTKNNAYEKLIEMDNLIKNYITEFNKVIKNEKVENKAIQQQMIIIDDWILKNVSDYLTLVARYAKEKQDLNLLNQCNKTYNKYTKNQNNKKYFIETEKYLN